MNIFVINSGSSSIKYQMIKMPEEALACSGIVERIGSGDATITHNTYKDNEKQKHEAQSHIRNHVEGLQAVVDLLTDSKIGVIKDTSEISAVGHRVVHGGEKFSNISVVTESVKEEIKKLFPLAPLHNPANYRGIEVAEKVFPAAKQIAVFDTSFHQTMPEKAFRYAIPNKFYKENGIRAYGFHGTSHKYVSAKAEEYLQKKDIKVITLHLGNGCSVAAVKDGKCIDTSMGLGPMNGLVMGTRAGDIDQSIIFHMVREMGISVEQVNNILNKESGMLGLTGANDMRDINKAVEENGHDAVLAMDIYAYRAQKYIGSYIAALNGVDAVVFTAGVGENDVNTRERICSNLDALGIVMDKEKNRATGIKGVKDISHTSSKVKILVIPTNEEMEIARQCYQLMETNK
ncbi:acetate kinase [Danxiaibacter flavus]|uniref:Acetate kinase n=1 Tax=Danxiaibacter flavus TaxID=3049108 RepID=A0ABV3ZG30_9BACT|nr:acetate kinase [Chitinophagaceae bacterium DXS]